MWSSSEECYLTLINGQDEVWPIGRDLMTMSEKHPLGKRAPSSNSFIRTLLPCSCKPGLGYCSVSPVSSRYASPKQHARSESTDLHSATWGRQAKESLV